MWLLTGLSQSFFGERVNVTKRLSLCSWNICGLKDKLSDQDVLNFILKFDIVWLLETKKYFNLNVSDFNVYCNVSKAGYYRGGGYVN